MMNPARALLTTLLLIPTTAFAAESVVPEADRKKAMEKPKDEDHGWKVTANIGGTGSINHSDSVVGADDGLTIQVGIVLESTAVYKDATHDWETTGKIQHSQTRTPQLDQFVKSIDNLELKSTYMYHFDDPKWIGPFGRFKLTTQIFKGYAIQASDDVVVVRAGVQAEEATAAQSQIALTKAFEPLTLRESVGAYADVFKDKRVTIKSKLGVGAQQIITQDGFVTANQDAAQVVTVRGDDVKQFLLDQLQSTNEIGAELEFDFGGLLVDELVSWGFNSNFFFPIVSSGGKDLDGLDALNIELNGKLSFKLVKWLSIDYVLTARRIPQVQEDFQVQNSLLLSAAFSVL